MKQSINRTHKTTISTNINQFYPTTKSYPPFSKKSHKNQQIATPHHLAIHFVATIIAYLRHAICVGDSLPRVGNIFDVTNPGLTTIAYLRHAARSTRPTATMQASAAMPPHCHKGRVERAVPRRGTIIVSPTQLVPEVLAVWGSRNKKGKRVVDTRLWSHHFHHPPNSL